MAKSSIRIDIRKIRRMREDAGFSRRPFAAEVGISFSYLAQLETGQRDSVSPEVAAKFAEALGTSIPALRAAE